MLLPVLGLIFGFSIFAALAFVVLRFLPRPGLRVATFVAFVLGAQIGFGIYGVIFTRLFADSHQQLTSRSSVIAFLIGIPIFAVLFGWAGASLMARVRKKPGE